MPKIRPDRPPPPKKTNLTFIEQNDFLMQQNQQDPHISDFAVTQSAKDLTREKGRDLTQSYDKSPYTNRNVKRAK